MSSALPQPATAPTLEAAREPNRPAQRHSQQTEPVRITARGNALFKQVRRLAHDPGAYRRLHQVWLEGDHLLCAMLARGLVPDWVLMSESAWALPEMHRLADGAARVAVLPDGLFAELSALESPARVGALLVRSPAPSLQPAMASVVLDRVQDAGNVGSILRSAAAFGVTQVLALKGTAALWSPKVLRAGMGAHFALQLLEGLEPAELSALQVPLVGTALSGERLLHQTDLPWPCAWVLGHEGQGVAPELLARCAAVVRIAQPGGEQSLNVAAAAAVCLHESARARLRSGA
jgi:TrmH family RNA methyltransferase